MSFLHALILSIVEGLTEYLPISSTGHMVLAAKLLNIPQTEFVKSFEIIIQFGAVLAVAFLYAKRLLTRRGLWKPLFFAFMPTALLGLVLYKTIKSLLLGNLWVTVISLFLGGVFLIVFERVWKPKEKQVSAESLSIKQSLVIGLAQSISMIPGVSRAASCIVGGMVVGMSRKDAVEFSFLLAVPTIFAATVLDVVKTQMQFTPAEVQTLAIGFIGAFITALLAVRFFIQYAQKHTLSAFGVYRVVLALAFFFTFFEK